MAFQSTETSPETCVLSIQSFVTHGYVGNKASTFALQALGVEVDSINTVNFSNHTGYPSWKGTTLSADQLSDIFEGLKANQLDNYTHFLTGYVRGEECLRSILKIHKQLKQKNPNLMYVCDPVMGDGGKLYVPEPLVKIYSEEVIPISDVILPNQTEAEFLTGCKISNLEDAFKVIDILHKRGPKTVILKSLELEKPSTILCIGSSIATGSPIRFQCRIPALDKYFSGTGDLFSALFTGWASKGLSFIEIVEKTLNAIRAILLLTEKHNSKELKLLKGRDLLINPPNDLKIILN